MEIKAETEPEIVRWQRGNIECQVTGGNRDVKVNEFLNVRIHYRIFRHADAPFQLGGAQWSISIIGGDENSNVDAKMTLQEIGQDAQAKYPDLGV